MKGRGGGRSGGGGQIDPPPAEKTTFEMPSLIMVNTNTECDSCDKARKLTVFFKCHWKAFNFGQ